MGRPILIDSVYEDVNIVEPEDFASDECEQVSPGSGSVSPSIPAVYTDKSCTEITTAGQHVSLDANSSVVFGETFDKIRAPPRFVCTEREYLSLNRVDSLKRVVDTPRLDADNVDILAIKEDECTNSEDSSDFDSSCSVDEISLESIFENISEEWDYPNGHEKEDIVPKTANEITDLPVKKPDIQLSHLTPIEYVGEILHIMPDCVVIKSNKGRKILDLDSLLCLEDLTIIGYITETFGPIERPFYLVQLGQKKSTSPLEDLSASAGRSKDISELIDTEEVEPTSSESGLNNAQFLKTVEGRKIDEQDVGSVSCKMDILKGDGAPHSEDRNISVTGNRNTQEDTIGYDTSVERNILANSSKEDICMFVSMPEVNQKSFVQDAINDLDHIATCNSKDSRTQKDPQHEENGLGDTDTALNSSFSSTATEQLPPPPVIHTAFENSTSKSFDDNDTSQLLKKLRCKMPVFYSVEYSKTVTPENVYTVGCDASNAYDEEVPECDQEFSDDEKERTAKLLNSIRAKKRAQKATPEIKPNADVKKSCVTTTNGQLHLPIASTAKDCRDANQLPVRA